MTCPAAGGGHLSIRSLGVSSAAEGCRAGRGGTGVVFVGDDWVQDHHDIEITDDEGRRLARAAGLRGWKVLAGRRRHAPRYPHRPTTTRCARWRSPPTAPGSPPRP